MRRRPALRNPAEWLNARLEPHTWGRGDGLIVLVSGVLVLIGLVMVYSASSALATSRYGDPTHFISRQALWAAVGVAAFGAGAVIDYHWWRRVVVPLTLAAIAILAAVLVAGWTVNGSRRWLRAGGFTIQPSEFARVVFIVYLAHVLAKRGETLRSFRALAPGLAVVAVGVGLIVAEPDLGNAVVLATVAGLLCVLGGARLTHLGVLAACAVPLVAYAVLSTPYRRRRWFAFLDPWSDPTDSGFQVIQSLLALGGGGAAGVGLGEGRQKLFFLPEPHTDFIYSVVGEELGVWGTLAILALFTALLWRGWRVALATADPFGRLLAFGLSVAIGLAAALNIGVATGVLPTKGLPLPLVSYGGSSLVANLLAVGILFNISRQRGVGWGCGS
jgi:cell division protein FtsW